MKGRVPYRWWCVCRAMHCTSVKHGMAVNATTNVTTILRPVMEHSTVRLI